MLRRLFALLMLVIVGCSSADEGAVPAASDGPTSIRVFAAASLTEPFQKAAEEIPQVRPTFSFAGSQQLVTQLTQGAEADVVATADEATMERVVAAGLVDPPVTFAHNTLVIAVRPGNPSAITGLADLARPGLTVVVADPSVPVGRYTKQVLEAAGVKLTPRSLELDVKAALAKVTAGEVDAAVVYTTDVRSSGGKADAVAFPEAAAPGAAAAYPIAVVRSTRHRAAAEAFVAAAKAGPVHDALLAAGFAP